MVRYSVAFLLLAVSAALWGCASGRSPTRAHPPVVAEEVEETPEPNHASSITPPVQPEMPVEQAQTSGPSIQDANVPRPSDPEPTLPLVTEEGGPSAEPNQPEIAAPAIEEPIVEPSRVSESAVVPSFHDQYAAILAAYVRADSLVEYSDLRRRRLEIKPALTTLDELDPNVYQGWSQQEKLAFWINAYNLKMLDIIARNYPIESSWWLRLTWSPNDIRHIGGIWTDYKFIVMDEEFTLAEVEQRFFRRMFDDPRVYLALTYACQSSPPLPTRPYQGRTLDQELDEQVRQFLTSPQGLQIDRRDNVVRLSALFKPSWRGKEFVGRYGTDKKFKSRDPATRAVLNFILSYLPREDVEFLEVENYSLEYLNFDWRLNDTSRGY